MIEIKRLEFMEGETTLEFGENNSLTLRASSNGQGLPYDVLFRAFGKEVLYENFASVQTALTEGGKTKFEPDLLCITAGEQRSFAAVVGLYKVVFVDPQKGSITEILFLNRKTTDDQGFYRLNVQPLEDGLLLIYEGGATRISEDGYVVWHCHLAWDDIYRGTDGKSLYYSSEFGEFAPDDWAISVADGARFKLVRQ